MLSESSVSAPRLWNCLILLYCSPDALHHLDLWLADKIFDPSRCDCCVSMVMKVPTEWQRPPHWSFQLWSSCSGLPGVPPVTLSPILSCGKLQQNGNVLLTFVLWNHLNRDRKYLPVKICLVDNTASERSWRCTAGGRGSGVEAGQYLRNNISRWRLLTWYQNLASFMMDYIMY